MGTHARGCLPPPSGHPRGHQRFRRELKTDYIDVCLLHCLTDPAWREKMKPAMEVLSEARQKDQIRAVGCSCHTIEALKAASEEPWVEIILARFNPYATIMDVNKREEVPRVAAILEAAHTIPLTAVQLHGDEPDDVVASLPWRTVRAPPDR